MSDKHTFTADEVRKDIEEARCAGLYDHREGRWMIAHAEAYAALLDAQVVDDAEVERLRGLVTHYEACAMQDSKRRERQRMQGR